VEFATDDPPDRVLVNPPVARLLTVRRVENWGWDEPTARIGRVSLVGERAEVQIVWWGPPGAVASFDPANPDRTLIQRGWEMLPGNTCRPGSYETKDITEERGYRTTDDLREWRDAFELRYYSGQRLLEWQPDDLAAVYGGQLDDTMLAWQRALTEQVVQARLPQQFPTARSYPGPILAEIRVGLERAVEMRRPAEARAELLIDADAGTYDGIILGDDTEICFTSPITLSARGQLAVTLPLSVPLPPGDPRPRPVREGSYARRSTTWSAGPGYADPARHRVLRPGSPYGPRTDPRLAPRTPNAEQPVLDAIDELVNEQLRPGPVDNYEINRYPKCAECGHDWHGLECEDDGCDCLATDWLTGGAGSR
jgi:hypothetical protein